MYIWTYMCAHNPQSSVIITTWFRTSIEPWGEHFLFYCLKFSFWPRNRKYSFLYFSFSHPWTHSWTRVTHYIYHTLCGVSFPIISVMWSAAGYPCIDCHSLIKPLKLKHNFQCKNTCDCNGLIQELQPWCWADKSKSCWGKAHPSFCHIQSF